MLQDPVMERNDDQRVEQLEIRRFTEFANQRNYNPNNRDTSDNPHPHDDDFSFFEKGRDFESIYVNHKYTPGEKEILASYDSVDYLPPHSQVYKHWLLRYPSRFGIDNWIMMGMIGFAVGLIGFLLHEFIDLIADFKWDYAQDFIRAHEYAKAWMWCCGYSIIFVLVGSGLVIFLRPCAAGSGIPELIGFLNGTLVRHIFNIKTLVIKFFSCICAVASGLPVGPEGPMIHLGALVGAGLSQLKSSTLGFKLSYMQRFRNSEDRRNFISAGAAAGVASAFGAPVGGLLFAMEEVSSFWNMKLSWQIFFCCMVSAFTTDLFSSAFRGFKYQGDFGLFKVNSYILFQVDKGVALNIVALIPAVILGVCGGLLGALFNIINLKIAKTRRRLLAAIQRESVRKLIKLLEPALIMIIFATVSVLLPAAFPCSPYTCRSDGDSTFYSPQCLSDVGKLSPLHTESSVQHYTCEQHGRVDINGTSYTNGSFNQVATLLFLTGEGAIRHLLSRETHLEFSAVSLAAVLPIYFLLACWCAGTSIASGLVVPMLFIGALYGRLLGYAMVTLFGVHTQTTDPYWAWIDPGAMALIGAASFFAGVSRLTMSLTVILIEITNDVQFLLLIMVTIMVSKWVGDLLTHPLYHALLELKCIPFLDTEPTILAEDSKHAMNLELYRAEHVMSHPVFTVSVRDNVTRLAGLLLNTSHNGFPVTKPIDGGRNVLCGLITKTELLVILSNEGGFVTDPGGGEEGSEMAHTPATDTEVTHIEYPQFSIDHVPDLDTCNALLYRYCNEAHYHNMYIDLSPYMNESPVTVQQTFSLHRTYIIFRTLGLRHLTVVDNSNQVVGMITRKDLMGHQLEESLTRHMEQQRITSQSTPPDDTT